MSKVLFVLSGLLESVEPNANCINNILNFFNNDIECHSLSIEKKYDALNKKNELFHTIVYSESIYGMKNWIRKIKKFFYMPLGSNLLVKKIYDKIQKLYDHYKYNSIIAVVNPVESAEAVYRFKKNNPKVKCILYEIDPASNRYKNPAGLIERLWKKKSIRWEQKIYSSFDFIIHMQTHKVHFSQKYYKKFADKTLFLDIPIFRIFNYKQKNMDLTDIRFLYAGVFYQKLREPDYMINIFKHLEKSMNFSLNIYTGGIMKKYVENLIRGSQAIQLFDLIEQSALNKVVEKSDVLISVGNVNSDFLPSKVLYYIGTGKKIIHFFSDENDVANNYLKRYKNALLVDQRKDVDLNVEKIKDFLEIEYYPISSAELINLYVKNTPEYTAQKFMEII